MKRRDFLKALGIGTLLAISPLPILKKKAAPTVRLGPIKTEWKPGLYGNWLQYADYLNPSEVRELKMLMWRNMKETAKTTGLRLVPGTFKVFHLEPSLNTCFTRGVVAWKAQLA